jgi:hypothetical protein
LIAAHRSADAGFALAKATSIYAQTEAPAARFDEIRLLQDQLHAK